MCAICKVNLELHQAAWIEFVDWGNRKDADTDELHMMIEHTYPDGISIDPFVQSVLKRVLRPEVKAIVNYKQVEPGSGYEKYEQWMRRKHR